MKLLLKLEGGSKKQNETKSEISDSWIKVCLGKFRKLCMKKYKNMKLMTKIFNVLFVFFNKIQKDQLVYSM